MYPQSPLISVIVPNYNGSRFLGTALSSIERQSYPHLEVLVVDDCSTDDSPEVANAFARRDSRFRLLRNASNLGVAAVRRRGVEASRGELLTTLDNDDVLLDEHKLAKELRVIQDMRDADGVVAFSEVKLIDVHGNVIGTPLHGSNAPEGWLFEEFLVRAVPIPRDMTLSRRLYERVGGFDPGIRIFEDWDFKLRLARAAQFRFSGSAGVGYRRHGKGLSSDKARCAEWLERVFRKNVGEAEHAEALLTELLHNWNGSAWRRLRNRAREFLHSLGSAGYSKGT
jgi:glycosyltransferase involved in cell wall biosynthesis